MTSARRPRVHALLARVRHEERGGSLVESLVASTLLAVALVVLMGSFSTFAIATTDARQIALAQATVRAQLARIKAAPYQANGNYSSYFEPLPAGLGRTVGVTWWDGTSTWVGSQNGNGLQKITLAIQYAGRSVTTLESVKADR